MRGLFLKTTFPCFESRNGCKEGTIFDHAKSCFPVVYFIVISSICPLPSNIQLQKPRKVQYYKVCDGARVSHGGQVFAPFENTFSTRIPIFEINEFHVQFIEFATTPARYKLSLATYMARRRLEV